MPPALTNIGRITVVVGGLVLAGAGPVSSSQATAPPTPAPAAAPQTSVPSEVWSAINSAFGLSVVSTFISAFAGTWGAQLLAERVARRKELLLEIRGVNAALGLAFNIANTYITVKKQHIRELVTAYEKQRADWQAYQVELAAGTLAPGSVFKYQMELRITAVPFSPIEALQRALVDRISPDGRALVLLTPLVQCIHGFADIVAQRNAWIEEVKRLPVDDEQHKAALYFGAPSAPGRVDDRYPTMLKAIGLYTDDCIGFSILIAESLKNYGDRLAATFGRGAPKIATPDFSKAGDLTPDLAAYSSWLQN